MLKRSLSLTVALLAFCMPALVWAQDDQVATDPEVKALVKKLVKKVSTRDGVEGRKAAADMLGYIGDRSVLSDLAELARVYPQDLRAKVDEAIGRIGGPKALRILATEMGNRYLLQEWNWDALVALGEAMARIDHADRKQYDLVKNRYEKGCKYSEGKPEPAMHFAMAMYGSDASIQSIVNWMNTEKPEMRYFCAEQLAFMGNRKSDGALCMTLEYEKDQKLRRIAAMSLGRRHSKESYESLVYALDDGLALETTQALGMIGNPKGIEPLKEHLKDKNAAVRLNVAFALARLGDKSGVDEAKKQLGSKDLLVAAKAAATLVAAGDASGMDKLKAAWAKLDAKQRYWFIFDNLAGDKWALPFLKDVAANDKYPGIKRYAEELTK